MASEVLPQSWSGEVPYRNSICLKKFQLYETPSNFYMVGRDKSKTIWRVLKIDRLEHSELNVQEDSITYSECECHGLLERLNHGNKSTGGLKFVITCYGIVGFIKFLGPYYMLLITKRRKIGVICGHAVYAITGSKMISIPNSSMQSKMAYSKNENRYKRLLCAVDLTKDFFFSYSYPVMHSLQKNMCNHEAGQLNYETMFVWNEFITRGIRNHLKNTLWTVPLVYGFFKQVKFSTSGRDFNFTLIARRSRHYAGPRYLKRGANEKGRVANDVETEQIVFEDVAEGFLTQISSVVQNRGSIPLLWSQETSPLNIKPDIVVSKKDPNYEATKLHFKNLESRYGNTIVILDLIKAHEKKPRESILRVEFCNAIAVINKELSVENCLKFLHWDLNKFARNKTIDVLAVLVKIAACAMELTGFFYSQVPRISWTREMLNWSYLCSLPKKDTDNSKDEICCGDHPFEPALQKGVLRTNCIDCLDRTNVAQYAYGLVALGHQLHALGLRDTPNVDLDSPLAYDLMRTYEMMGDTIALQYGGSAAHNKIFCQRRGQWKATTQSLELIRIIQRYYSNAYRDAEKQDAINVFLGHFQPHPAKPQLWELDSDQHHSIGRGSNHSEEYSCSSFKRSFSDGNCIRESNSPTEKTNLDNGEDINLPLLSAEKMQCGNKKDLSGVGEQWDSFTCSNFLEADWHSSSGNSCAEAERYTLSSSPIADLSSDSVVSVLKIDTSASESGSSTQGREPSVTDLYYGASSSSDVLDEFSDTFVTWVERSCLLDFRH